MTLAGARRKSMIVSRVGSFYGQVMGFTSRSIPQLKLRGG